MIKSYHRVQHTPSTAYTAYCIIPRSTVTSSQPFSSLGRPCCTQFSTFAQLRVNQWIKSPLPSHLPSELTTSRLTTSKYSSNLARWWPPSASSNLLKHGLQVQLQTRSIVASKCISKVALLQIPNSLHCGLQVHLQTRTIAASKCISKLARSRCPSASPNSLGHGLRVYPWVHLIVIFRHTSKLGKIECVFRIMRWCLSTPVSPTYILPLAESISVIPVSPNVYI